MTHSLEAVVEDVVNWVGVDANTASPALLTHVSGIGPKLAETIVAYRDENGPFASRAELRRVPKLAKRHCSICRLSAHHQWQDALDATAIHPESYPIARKVLERAKVRPEATPEERRRALALLRKSPGVEALAEEMGAGVPTLTDIFDQLARPGRDPRADARLLFSARMFSKWKI